MIVHLDSNMVPAHLRQGYNGKMFKAQVCEQVTIPMTAGLWEGGSRDLYRVIRLADGKSIEPVNQSAAPWDKRRDTIIALKPGIAVIEHSIFCGKDHGLRFYVHPADAAKLLPAPVELSDIERTILRATRAYKASYGGRDRYDMARDDAGYKTSTSYGPAVNFPSRTDWHAAKAGLVNRGYLNKAGAITTAGRNSIA